MVHLSCSRPVPRRGCPRRESQRRRPRRARSLHSVPQASLGRADPSRLARRPRDLRELRRMDAHRRGAHLPARRRRDPTGTRGARRVGPALGARPAEERNERGADDDVGRSERFLGTAWSFSRGIDRPDPETTSGCPSRGPRWRLRRRGRIRCRSLSRRPPDAPTGASGGPAGRGRPAQGVHASPTELSPTHSTLDFIGSWVETSRRLTQGTPDSLTHDEAGP